MRITSFQPPQTGGTLYVGEAVSTRGREYLWWARLGSDCSTFRNEGNGLLWRVTAPRALAHAAERAIRAHTAS